MKLLLDENLAPRLVLGLGDVFPESTHVRQVGLARSPDLEIWAYAREHGFTIVSKDWDFQQLSLLFGAPPKVIWLRLGNCTVSRTEDVLRANVGGIRRFGADAEAALLILS